MQKRLTFAAAVAACLLVSAQVHAQPGPPDDHGHGGPDRDHAEAHHAAPAHHTTHHYERHASKRYHVDAYARPPAYRDHHWAHGEQLPQDYRDKRYVIDYRSYHLSAPPRGYEWVRVDNNALLVAVTTGVISSVVTSLFYQQ